MKLSKHNIPNERTIFMKLTKNYTKYFTVSVLAMLIGFSCSRLIAEKETQPTLVDNNNIDWDYIDSKIYATQEDLQHLFPLSSYQDVFWTVHVRSGIDEVSYLWLHRLILEKAPF